MVLAVTVTCGSICVACLTP
ncbi:hypothetical protein L3V32_24635 [Vibrio sp. J2-4]|nr:hypothetical protein [Vibrio sp. J2-4]